MLVHTCLNLPKGVGPFSVAGLVVIWPNLHPVLQYKVGIRMAEIAMADGNTIPLIKFDWGLPHV